MPLELGDPAPELDLPEVTDGRAVTLTDLVGDGALLVAFLSRDCPCVEHVPDTVAALAREYGRRGVTVVAVCAPDLFVVDAQRRLASRGRMDASRPGRGEPTGEELRAALDAVLEGRQVPREQHPSLGCSITWSPGNEPG